MRRTRQELSKEETLEILKRNTSGVLALCGMDQKPYAVPLSYVYADQKIYFHGGYTHGNRHIYNQKITGIISCYDFASSYPFVMLSERYASEKFTPMENRSINAILEDAENNAYFFKLIMIDVELEDYFFPMPALQFSKCVKCINPVLDNGRILTADYVEIWLTEIDLQVIAKQYKYQKHLCTNVYAAHKDYLPRWFTDKTIFFKQRNKFNR